MVRGALAGEGKKLGCWIGIGGRVRLLISTFDPSLYLCLPGTSLDAYF